MRIALNQVATPPAAAGVDWDGQSRPAGSTDLGADEYAATSTLPNPSANLRIIRE
jgi:hypothetical protein